MKKFFCLVFITLFSTSCINNYEKRGYAFELSDYHLLQEGISSKETVLKTMGSPTIISDFNSEETWIYYSEEVNKVLFFIPKVTTRNVLAINFDNSETISKLEKFDLSNENSRFIFEKNYTQIKSRKTGFFKSIFGNIGQVRAQ